VYLLDTNVVSELRRGRRGDRGVRDWFDSIPTEEMHLSVITDLELEIGVLGMERRDREQGMRFRSWLTAIRSEFGPRLLPVHVEDARLAAALHVPDRRPYADALIAATALRRGLTMVTRNERDFRVQGLRVLNPFRG